MVDGAIRVVTKGPIANQRQIEQMKLLLTYPENFFFMNDADSFCLSPELPAYLYAAPDVVWSTYVRDTLPLNQPGYIGYPADFPHAALQPPYFMSRRSIEKMLAVADQIVPNEIMPWIDHFMLQMAYAAKLEYRRFENSIAADLDRYPRNLPSAVATARNGAVFVHSSKSPKTWRPLMAARLEYLRGQINRKGVKA